MPETSAGTTLAVRYGPAGKLEFHVRLPNVTADSREIGPETDAPVSIGTEPPVTPRGMEVLHRVLDDQSRAGGKRGRTFAFVCAALCCLMIGFSLFRSDTPATRPATPNASGIDDIEPVDPETSDAQPVQTRELAPSAVVQIAAEADEPRSDDAVQQATFEPPAALPIRGVWLDGSILPDESGKP
jgi:hypothetical protein